VIFFRVHLIPTLSQIILIPNFFYNFLLAENLKDEYDTDLGLECDEKELYKEFRYEKQELFLNSYLDIK